MSGTRAGGLKASATNKQRHGEDFFARIGKKGGENGHTGGFASNPELARKAGRKGGSKSRRGKPLTQEEQIKMVYLHDSGNSIADISRAIGRDYNTVKRFINNLWSEE